jgi:hypothetical protein
MRLFHLLLTVVVGTGAMAQDAKPAGPAAGVLSATEIQRLMPATVFFHGQSASVQMRNSFGVRLPKGGLVLAGLVDTGGYSTALRDKYQFYLLTDTAVELADRKISPGSYGCGFVEGKLLVMDLGGNELYRAVVAHDESMVRPRPLQIVVGKAVEEFRLYLGRDYVVLRP